MPCCLIPLYKKSFIHLYLVAPTPCLGPWGGIHPPSVARTFHRQDTSNKIRIFDCLSAFQSISREDSMFDVLVRTWPLFIGLRILIWRPVVLPVSRPKKSNEVVFHGFRADVGSNWILPTKKRNEFLEWDNSCISRLHFQRNREGEVGSVVNGSDQIPETRSGFKSSPRFLSGKNSYVAHASVFESLVDLRRNRWIRELRRRTSRDLADFAIRENLIHLTPESWRWMSKETRAVLEDTHFVVVIGLRM